MEKLWGLVVKSFEQDTVMWIGGFIILMLALAASHKSEPGWLAYRPKGYNRGKRMLRRARREFVDNLVTQEFVDSVEMNVYNGNITRQEASEVYRRMKQLFPIRNLFPKPELLKENIKKRLGKHVEPNLPGKVVKIRAKNLFDNSPKRVAL
jgi:hypothetical protein